MFYLALVASGAIGTICRLVRRASPWVRVGAARAWLDRSLGESVVPSLVCPPGRPARTVFDGPSSR